jgi:hypothetical protein
MRKLIYIIAIAVSLNLIFAQAYYTDQDIEICNSKFQLAVEKNLAELPIGDLMIEIGRSFLGTEYVAHTLEKGEKEQVVINLSGLDCYTFFESTLALARSVKLGKTTFDDYLKQIELFRYRNGKMIDYPSRLHYSTDVIYDNAKKNILTDVTKEIGGELYENEVYFMSENPDKYKFLKDNPEFVKRISAIEKEINQRTQYFIPQEKIEKLESGIQDGDIIAITTDIDGLDVAHTGMALRLDDGRVYFIHAPSVGHKVEITEKPLSDYVKKNKRQTGIIVARPLEP